jgi:hypothetical protein
MLNLHQSLQTRRHVDLAVKNQTLSKTQLKLDKNPSTFFFMKINIYTHIQT